MNKTKKEEWILSPQSNRDMHAPDFVEAICAHGVGHHNGVHGCHMGKDGKACCYNCPPEIWAQVTKD